MANGRKGSSLSAIAFVFALALLAPWHVASAGASSGDVEHHAGCPLVSDGAQPVLAPAPKAALALFEAPAGGVPSQLVPDPAERFCLAVLPAPASARPLYLLSSRLRR